MSDDIPERELLNLKESIAILGVSVRRLNRAALRCATAADRLSASLTLLSLEGDHLIDYHES